MIYELLRVENAVPLENWALGHFEDKIIFNGWLSNMQIERHKASSLRVERYLQICM